MTIDEFLDINGIDVNTDDGSCYPVIQGCTETSAFNFNDYDNDNIGNDLTNDNLIDLVVYPYSNSGTPIVYVNTGAGIFARLDDQKLPQEPTNWGTSASSDFFDYNKDGILDLIIGPMNGIQRDHLEQDWILYQGTSHLSMDDYSLSLIHI